MLLLNKKLIKSNVACKFFPAPTSKDVIYNIKTTFQENEFDTSILHMGVNVLKLGSNIDIVLEDVERYYKCCKLLQTLRFEANHYFWIETYCAVKCKFYLRFFVKNMVVVLLITAMHHLRIYRKTDYILTQVKVFYRTITL